MENNNKLKPAQPLTKKYFLSPANVPPKNTDTKKELDKLKSNKHFFTETEEELIPSLGEESDNYLKDSLMKNEFTRYFKNKILEPINKKRRIEGYHEIDLKTYQDGEKLKIILTNPNNFNNNDKYKLENIGTTTILTLKTMIDFINQDNKDNPIITSEITTVKSKIIFTNGEATFTVNNLKLVMNKLSMIDDKSVNNYQKKILASRLNENLDLFR
jgi:hypothetical protein